MTVTTVKEANAALQRLAKWRGHFAGWLLGTRSRSDPQSQWARNTAEGMLLIRAEVNALAVMLIDNGVLDQEKFTIQIGQEAADLDKKLSEKWPGVTSRDDGLHYDLEKVNAAGWMKNWLP